MLRTPWQKFKDTLSFPLRALVLFYSDQWGLSAQSTERFDYVAREVEGFCLDVGCGRNNRFIKEFLGGNGRGLDVYPYEGLLEENLVADLTHFPFDDQSFLAVTFIANINHVPRSQRDIELAEAHRCLKVGGKIVITMGNPVAEILVHKLMHLYDSCLGTRVDVDTERGMGEEEEFYLTDKEIRDRLLRAGFTNIQKKYFVTQWFLNHLFVGRKAG
jgi:SAM-dependent methyltransferase